MGSESFVVTGKGKTPLEAFQKAVEDAAYWFGHSGYTGTIAEKEDFILLRAPDEKVFAKYLSAASTILQEEGERIISFAEELLTESNLHAVALQNFACDFNSYAWQANRNDVDIFDEDGDNRTADVLDKWGPAGCFEVPNMPTDERMFVFFGFASF